MHACMLDQHGNGIIFPLTEGPEEEKQGCKGDPAADTKMLAAAARRLHLEGDRYGTES